MSTTTHGGHANFITEWLQQFIFNFWLCNIVCNIFNATSSFKFECTLRMLSVLIQPRVCYISINVVVFVVFFFWALFAEYGRIVNISWREIIDANETRHVFSTSSSRLSVWCTQLTQEATIFKSKDEWIRVSTGPTLSYREREREREAKIRQRFRHDSVITRSS